MTSREPWAGDPESSGVTLSVKLNLADDYSYAELERSETLHLPKKQSPALL